MSDDPGSTSLEIAVIVRDPLWRDATPLLEDLARRAAAAVFRYEGVGHGRTRPTEVCIVLGDDALVCDLNRTYRQRNCPTNVLAFGNDGMGSDADAPRLLGDVILARETVLREAAEQGKSMADHLSHLVVHGMLHLFGFDHGGDREAEEMEAFEILILAEIGIADPYRDPALKAAQR